MTMACSYRLGEEAMMKWSALQGSDTICAQEMLMLVNVFVELSGSGVSGPACAVPVHLLMVLQCGQ